MTKMTKDIATLAGGCFWCTEAVFARLKGVISVIPGYSGGSKPNPTYDEVCSGTTDHAEAIQIKFDPTQISFEKLLDVFWQLHDPTTLNRQGTDVGTQYRSSIFYHSDDQKKVAKKSRERVEKSKMYKDKLVTEIVPFKEFYKAENYHKNYFDSNRQEPYCQIVIDPKIQKLYKLFPNKIKNSKVYVSPKDKLKDFKDVTKEDKTS